jgi:hypothetical protein
MIRFVYLEVDVCKKNDNKKSLLSFFVINFVCTCPYSV